MPDYNSYEPTRQNFFFDTIKANIAKENEDGTLEKKIESLVSKNFKNIDTSEYIALGNLAYFIGLDVFQAPVLTEALIKKFRQRFADLNLSEKILAGFFQAIRDLDPVELEAPKEKMKSLIHQKIEFENKLTLVDLRNAINSVIKNSSLPVSNCEDVYELMNQPNYSYGDLLKFNSLFYQSLNLNGACIEKSLKIFTDATFIANLKIAQQLYDSQKYALIYIDSILSAKEAINKFGEYWYWLEVSEDRLEEELAKLPEPEVTKDAEPIMEEPTPEQVEDVHNLAEADPNKMVIAYVEEVNGKKLEGETVAQDLLDGFKHIVTNTDLAQDLYKYMKAKTQLNRGNFEKLIPGSNMDIFSELLNKELAELGAQYKADVELLTQEIPADLINRIVIYVNDTIKSLNIIGEKRKGYMLTQLAENQIKTYNHLQQILSVIEECDIYGDKLASYATLSRFLKEQTKAVEIFEQSLNIENVSFNLSFFTGVKEFFFPVTKTEELEPGSAEIIAE